MADRGLRQIIGEEIRKQGPLTFARFMELCLYHPEFGYYTSGRGWQGRGGDYYTAPTVHPLFGKLLGRQIAQMWWVMGGGSFSLWEMGGGEGYLGKDILDYLQREVPDLYGVLDYHMVEVSPANLERQRRHLAPHKGKVSWHEPQGLGELEVEGCFLANELVDAFPVHRVVMQDGRLKEIYVDAGEEGLREVLGDPSTPELTGYFRRLGITLVEGQRGEVNLAALRWIKGVAQGLEKGFVLTIDYGYLAEELYSPWRTEGTLLCYRGHRVSEDPYIDLGLQDMTAHVDFTSLIQWGERYGLSFTGLVPQYRFLLALGALEEVACLDEQERLTAKNLILPGGMGEGFKVLIQHKGIESPQLVGLQGLKEVAYGT